MEYNFVETKDRFSFDAQVRLMINVGNGAKKYLSRSESILLACLLDGPQRKEQVMQRVWFDRGVVVTDASYYQLITQLRKSFVELGLPKEVIKTIPRYGIELAATPVDDCTQVEKGADESENDSAFCVDGVSPTPAVQSLNQQGGFTRFVPKRPQPLRHRAAFALACVLLAGGLLAKHWRLDNHQWSNHEQAIVGQSAIDWNHQG